MNWDEKMSVGVALMDDQHKKLIALLNELFDAMIAGHGRDQLGHITDELIDYTRTHFAQEEKLIEQHGFPDVVGHHAAHEALTKQVFDVQQRHKAGGSAVLSMEVLNFLKSWLLNHIQGTDKKYGAYLNSKGIT
jgi:hemerythrin